MKNILLVDDDKAIHSLVNASLDKHEFRTTSAYDPAQAFTFVAKEKPDLILLDIKMPAGGGFEFYRRLHKLSKTSSIPIVILSALSKDDIEKNLADENNLVILTKPFSKEDLLEKVREAI